MQKKELLNKKKSAFIRICIFMAVLTIPMLSWGVLKTAGIFTPSLMEKLDFNLNENRNKSEFPDSFNPKTVTSELEAYFNDRVPFRSAIITVNRKIYSAMEMPYDTTIGPFLVKLLYNDDNTDKLTDTDDKDLDELWNDTPDNNTSSGEECHHKYTAVKTGEPDYENYGYIVYRCTLCGNEKTEYTYKLVDNSYFPLKVYNDRVIQGRSNWLFYSGDNSINYYAGDNVLTENIMAEWLETMQRLQDICDEKNIELLYMIMPNKEQVYGEYMPTVNMVDTYKREPRFVDYVREHSDIRIVYPIDELTAAKKQWQVYHKYDTHWNSAGGFIGTQVILKALGKPVTNLSSVSVNKCESTYIDLITIGDLDRSLYNSDTDYEIEYKPEINTILEEGEGENVRHFITDSPNKQSLVLIGDSFRNQMIRYISRDFEESTFAHRNDICDEKVREGLKNADVLVVSTVERNDSVMIENLNAIIEILSE